MTIREKCKARMKHQRLENLRKSWSKRAKRRRRKKQGESQKSVGINGEIQKQDTVTPSMSRTEARRGINIQIPTKLIKFPSSTKRGHDLHNSSRVDVRYRFPEDRCGVNKTKFKTEYRYILWRNDQTGLTFLY